MLYFFLQNTNNCLLSTREMLVPQPWGAFAEYLSVSVKQTAQSSAQEQVSDGWQGPHEQQVDWVIKHHRWTDVAASPHSEGVIAGRVLGHLTKGHGARDREAAMMEGKRPLIQLHHLAHHG